MENKCIVWTGHTWSQGRYGMDTIGGKCMTAHRAAWIRKNGPIDSELVVCHACDNGLCVNVDHLFLGTQSENMKDCARKGRLNLTSQKGQLNNNAKPNLEQRYREIKKSKSSGMSYSEIKRKFGLKSNGHIRQILLSEY